MSKCCYITWDVDLASIVLSNIWSNWKVLGGLRWLGSHSSTWADHLVSFFFIFYNVKTRNPSDIN